MPSLRSRTTATSGSTSFTIDLPPGTVAGDVLVLFQYTNIGTLAAMANPSGFGSPVLSRNAAGGTALRGKAWIKKATASEPTTFTLTQALNANGVAHLWAIAGGDLPGEDAIASSTAGSGMSITTPGITPGGSDDLEIRSAACSGNGVSRTIEPAAGFTEPSGADANSDGLTTANVAYRQLSSSAATSNETFTASGLIVSQARLGFTIAIPSSGETPVALDDEGAADDSSSVVAADVPLAETGTGAEALVVSRDIDLGDTASAVDDLAVAVTVPLAEMGTGVDAFAVGVPVPVGDSGAVADALTVTAAAALADAGTGVEAFAVAAGVPVADEGAGADALLAGLALDVALADAGVAADALVAREQRKIAAPEPPRTTWQAQMPRRTWTIRPPRTDDELVEV